MIVIDASIVIKLLYKEEASDTANDLLTSHLENKEKIIVPKFLFIEVANALTTKTSYTKGEIKDGLNLLYSFNFSIYELTKEDLIKASTFAKQYRTSVYDMLYAVIAKNKKIKLITADDNFVKKVGFPFVQSLTQFEQLAPR